MSFFEELKRRNVLRVAAAYIVAAWLIIQVAETIFPLFGFGDTPARLTVIVLAILFVPAVIFAWAFELTPEGLKREHEVDRSRSITPQTGKRLDRIIMVVLAIALGFFAFDRFVLSESRMETAREQGRSEALIESFGNRSVAVLPFANRSNNANDAFFVDGIHDDILTALARIGTLRVISRTSVEKFRETTLSMQEIGELLDVRTILEGGVQRAGDRVRINVQLIDVSTDNHLWANNFDRELTTANIFAIQSEVSTAIAGALDAALSPEEKQQLDSVPTKSLAALEAYFLGRQAMNKRTSASLGDAVRHFQRAVELDPNYAMAYVGLAESYHLQTRYSGLPAKEQDALGKPLLEKALAIDDRLGEAYIGMTVLVDDPQSVEALYKKGLDLAPGYSDGRAWYGGFLMGQGRYAEAYEQLNQAVRLDPLSLLAKTSLGNILQHLGRFDEARDQYESVIRIDANYARAYQTIGNLEWRVYGRLDNAVVWHRKATAIDPGSPAPLANLAALWLELGDQPKADYWANRLRATTETSGYRDWITWVTALTRKGPAGAVDFAQKVYAELPEDEGALWVLGVYDVTSGQPDTAVKRYRDAYPELLDDANPVIDDTNYWEAVSLAYCLQAAGENARANRLLDLSLAHIQTVPRLGRGGHAITDVYIFALLGRTNEALAALREAVEAGWRHDWRILLPHSPELAALHSEPEYQAIVAELEADMAAQVKRIREMEAKGELPPIPE